MRRFIKYSILFIGILVSILAIAEAVVRHYPNSYKYKHEWMTSNSMRVKTLILGGSHTYYGIEPSILGDSTFNLANVSQHPEYDYRLLKKYGDRCKNLKNLILVVDAVNVFDPPIEQLEGDRERCTYYRIYMGCDKHSLLSRYGLELLNIGTFKRKFTPALKYLITGRYTPDCNTLGRYDKDDGIDAGNNLENLKAASLKAVERHRCNDWSQVEYNRSWLDSLCCYCQNRDIQIILVTPPTWKDYYQNVNPKQIREMENVAAHVTERFNRAKYRNYMTDNRFVASNFIDGDHLSRQGAIKFTTILKTDFKF